MTEVKNGVRVRLKSYQVDCSESPEESTKIDRKKIKARPRQLLFDLLDMMKVYAGDEGTVVDADGMGSVGVSFDGKDRIVYITR